MTNLNFKLLTALAAIASLPSVALAADRIRSEAYVYDMEIAKDAQFSDPFVICSKCPDGKLTPTPAPVQLAMKFSDVLPLTNTDEKTEEGEKTSIQNEDKKKPMKGPTLIGSVYFDFDSSQIRFSEKKVIGGVGEGGRLSIKGYTCIVGGDKYNLLLSKKRAEAVAGILKKNGIKSMDVQGLGKSSENKEKRLNRRVDIYRSESEQNENKN